MDIHEAVATIRIALERRRKRLANSGLNDEGTRITLRLLDRVAISWGTTTITASLTDTSLNPRELRYVDAVLTAVLDAAPGTVRAINPATYRLTIA